MNEHNKSLLDAVLVFAGQHNITSVEVEFEDGVRAAIWWSADRGYQFLDISDPNSEVRDASSN